MLLIVILPIVFLLVYELQNNINQINGSEPIARNAFYVSYLLSGVYIGVWWLLNKTKLADISRSQVATHCMTVPLCIFSFCAFALKIYYKTSFYDLLVLGMKHSAYAFLAITGQYFFIVLGLVIQLFINTVSKYFFEQISVQSQMEENISRIYYISAVFVGIYQAIILCYCYRLRPVKNNIFGLCWKTVLVPAIQLILITLYLQLVSVPEIVAVTDAPDPALDIKKVSIYPLWKMMVIWLTTLAFAPTLLMVDCELDTAHEVKSELVDDQDDQPDEPEERNEQIERTDD